MANKVLLKKSSISSKVPLTSDLDYGEIALNYTDGKLYFKNSSNLIKSFTFDDSVVTLNGTQTLTNKTLSSPTLTGTLTAGGGVGTVGQVLASTGTGVEWITVGGTGTVSSVALSLPSIFTVSGSPITTAGTLSASFASQTANTFLAAPNGTNGAPTMRVIVAADIPTLNQNTTGSAATLTTGRTIALTGDVTYTSGAFNGSANVTGTATLANSGVTAGSYGGSTTIPVLTIDAKGRVTAASTSAITVGDGTLTLNTSGIATGSQTFTANQATGATFTVNVPGTNIGQGTRTETTVPITSSTGTGATLNPASTTLAGVMTADDKTKLDGIATGATANTGTVTSVGGTGTVSGLSLSGTVTSSGNLTLGGTLAVTASDFASQTANTILAAPNGLAGTPTFRALVAADIPTLNQNTTGSAATLTTGRTIALTGDVTYTSGSFNGSVNVTGAATLASVGTAGTYTKVTTDAKGRVTSGTTLTEADIPALDASKITTGIIDAARLPSYVDDVIEGANLAAFPATGETGKIYVALDTNKAYRWSGSTYVFITSGAVDSVGGYTGVVTATNLLDALKTVDGTGSGLDADLLDGNSAAAFYLATNPSGYTTNTGTVTSVGGTGTVAGLSLSGTVTTSGNLTLSGTLSTPISTINDSTTLGQNLVKLTNVAAIAFPRINANNTVSTLDAATFRTAIGAGTSSTTGTVTSVATSGTVSGLTLTGGTITTTGTITLGGTLAVTASNFASQTANTILAAPNGTAGTPTFRTLVAADVPTLNQNTTGSAATLTTSRNINGVAFNGSANITITAANPNALTIGTGLSGTSYTGSSAVTIAIDSTVVTLTGTQTLTNKSLAAFDQKTGTTTVANQNVTQASIATVAQTSIDNFASATYRSAKYVVQITQGSSYQVSEVMVLHNGTTTTMTEYGVLTSNGTLVSFATDISTGNVRLLATMNSATAATINITRTTLVV